MAFIGTPLDTRNTFQSLQGKRFNGDGSTTAFTLDVAPSSTLDIEVFVGNVRQDPNSAYTLSGTTLTFTGAPPSGTNNIYVVHQAKAVGTIEVPATNSGDTTFNGTITMNGGVVFNEESADVDFRVESNGNANAIFVNGGEDTVGIGNSNAHSFDDNADNLVVGTGSGHNGITIYSDGSSSGSLFFANGTSGAQTKQGQVLYEQNNSAMVFNTASTTETLRLVGGEIATGGETAPDVSAGGLCLDQNALDTAIFTLKSSDIDHGMTDHYETDTYLAIQKKSGSDGGVLAVAMCEGDQAWRINGYVNNDNSTQNATGNGAFHFQASKKTGSDVTVMGANANLMVVSNNGSTRFIVDEDGDVLHDGSASAYDSYNDAHLVRAMDLERADPATIINSKWDKFVDYNFDDLKKTGIFGYQSDEDYEAGKKPFIKMGALQRLHNGAIWQQYEKHQQLLEAVYDLAKEAVGEEKANAILDKHEVKRLQ